MTEPMSVEEDDKQVPELHRRGDPIPAAAVAVAVAAQICNNRKEKRKLTKKEKRKQKRKELAEKARQEEEAKLNDPEELRRIQLEEEKEKERLERERREFEERERLFLEALSRKKAQEEEEEEERRRVEDQEQNAKQSEVHSIRAKRTFTCPLLVQKIYADAIKHFTTLSYVDSVFNSLAVIAYQ